MKFNSETLTLKFRAGLSWFVRYRFILFIILLGIIYGFVISKIDTLVAVEPTQSAIEAKVSTSTNPHIDSSVVDKITQLQDNSVNVKTLFEQARQNPFQE
ncbi:MAG: hypothetical protein ABI220_03285 [Candidatus Saccharimonadales bacterium]